MHIMTTPITLLRLTLFRYFARRSFIIIIIIIIIIGLRDCPRAATAQRFAGRAQGPTGPFRGPRSRPHRHGTIRTPCTMHTNRTKRFTCTEQLYRVPEFGSFWFMVWCLFTFWWALNYPPPHVRMTVFFRVDVFSPSLEPFQCGLHTLISI
jgi:hypothetical protein